jgi:hypothetical protein
MNWLDPSRTTFRPRHIPIVVRWVFPADGTERPRAGPYPPLRTLVRTPRHPLSIHEEQYLLVTSVDAKLAAHRADGDVRAPPHGLPSDLLGTMMVGPTLPQQEIRGEKLRTISFKQRWDPVPSRGWGVRTRWYRPEESRRLCNSLVKGGWDPPTMPFIPTEPRLGATVARKTIDAAMECMRAAPSWTLASEEHGGPRGIGFEDTANLASSISPVDDTMVSCSKRIGVVAYAEVCVQGDCEGSRGLVQPYDKIRQFAAMRRLVTPPANCPISSCSHDGFVAARLDILGDVLYYVSKFPLSTLRGRVHTGDGTMRQILEVRR